VSVKRKSISLFFFHFFVIKIEKKERNRFRQMLAKQNTKLTQIYRHISNFLLQNSILQQTASSSSYQSIHLHLLTNISQVNLMLRSLSIFLYLSKINDQLR